MLNKLELSQTPASTRDYLPDEWEKIRAVIRQIQTVFSGSGYRELRTPLVEYKDVLNQGNLGSAMTASELRDRDGRAFTLRTDITVSVARVVGARYSDDAGPLRFQYAGACFPVEQNGTDQLKESYQLGVELIGLEAAEGGAEVLSLVAAALSAVGVVDYRIGVGHANLYRSLLQQVEVSPTVRDALMLELTTRDFVGLEREVKDGVSDPAVAEALLRCAKLRGGREILADEDQLIAAELAGLQELDRRVDPSVREHLIYDLGLVRDKAYYTSEIFEIYGSDSGKPIGGGGRYDSLLGNFGKPRPAVGMVFDLDALYEAIESGKNG